MCVTQTNVDDSDVKQQMIIVENGVNYNIKRYNDLKVANDRMKVDLKKRLDELEAQKKQYETLDAMKKAQTEDGTSQTYTTIYTYIHIYTNKTYIYRLSYNNKISIYGYMFIYLPLLANLYSHSILKFIHSHIHTFHRSPNNQSAAGDRFGGVSNSRKDPLLAEDAPHVVQVYITYVFNHYIHTYYIYIFDGQVEVQSVEVRLSYDWHGGNNAQHHERRRRRAVDAQRPGSLRYKHTYAYIDT